MRENKIIDSIQKIRRLSNDILFEPEEIDNRDLERYFFEFERIRRDMYDYVEGENTDYSRFFERFYRKDESHNIEKGGYGIGLSIAENIVERYKGDFKADWKDGRITFTCSFHMWKQKT